MSFDFIVKHEGRKIQRKKVRNIEDIEPIIDGLKEKFGLKKPKGER